MLHVAEFDRGDAAFAVVAGDAARCAGGVQRLRGVARLLRQPADVDPGPEVVGVALRGRTPELQHVVRRLLAAVLHVGGERGQLAVFGGTAQLVGFVARRLLGARQFFENGEGADAVAVGIALQRLASFGVRRVGEGGDQPPVFGQFGAVGRVACAEFVNQALPFAGQRAQFVAQTGGLGRALVLLRERAPQLFVALFEFGEQGRFACKAAPLTRRQRRGTVEDEALGEFAHLRVAIGFAARRRRHQCARGSRRARRRRRGQTRDDDQSGEHHRERRHARAWRAGLGDHGGWRRHGRIS
ncbi:MAG: hypothetical protein CAPSK01_000227 [Candidatus Accumulibacter vicinus]|uniref:Uncharacterized protein n=1 Tax=Candidatus Accumulibacter vicinus TaxID=2954382 RepID=A0A084Y537_9PROT|nr:MAG: hypothetical protein CAPSK01_000227 [Candidatus Accumulibacter vicinus]